MESGTESFRLCSAYVRDVYKFLPRKEVERLKLVSSAMDEAVMTANPSQLPRRVFYSLTIRSVRTDSR